MEYRDLYDENKNLTDQKIEKGEEVPKGLYYVTVVVFIKDSRNCFLLQINKKYNLWGATGGHPKSGEDSITGIITEIREELGYTAEEKDLVLVKTYKTEDDFVDLYYMEKDIDTSSLVLQNDEVASIRWYTKEEVELLIDKNMMIPSHIEFFRDIIKYLEEN